MIKTTRGLLGAACACLGLAACGTVPLAKADAHTIDGLIAEKMAASKVQGLAALVIKDDEIAWAGDYGYADAEAGRKVTDRTIFPIASVTKTVTGVAVMQLYEDGLVDLDESVNAYLPFRVVHPRYPDDRITIRMLLQHRSGIIDYDPVLDAAYTIESGHPDPDLGLDEFLKAYLLEGERWYDPRKNFSKGAPGTEYRYSNVGYALVGYIVELVAGMPFNEYCRERIFAPLGMGSTGFFSREIDASMLTLNYFKGKPLKPYSFATYPDGGLRTTTRDFAKFLRAIMNGGEADGRRILEESTVETMLPEDLTKRLIWEVDPMKDFRVESGGRAILGFTGGDPGVVTAAYFDRRSRTAVILFMNTIPPSTLFYSNIKRVVEALNELAGL